MTTAPVVELSYNPTDLRPRDLPSAGAFLGAPADALQAALAVTRVEMVRQLKEQVKGISEPTSAQLLRLADLAWQATFWKYRKISAPVIADAYVRAYQAAEAGDVPISVIYDLADKHAEKVGDYFHTSSRGALAEGFNSLVNRQVPAKAAADQVLDAYGLTSRQMRSYVSSRQQFSAPVWDVRPKTLKARARAFIDKSFTTRIRKLSLQEEHNIDQQAQQFAWMWLQDKGRLNKNAQKMWLTAKDERVCPQCGPLHGQKVGVNEQFVTDVGQFWTPGLHPNCRCQVRLIANTFSKADWDPREHPRGGAINPGRFRRVAEADRADLEGFQHWLDRSSAPQPESTELTSLSVTPLARPLKIPLQLSSLAPQLSELAAPEVSALGEGMLKPLVGDQPVARPLLRADMPVPHVPLGQPAPSSPTVPLSTDDRSFYSVVRPDDPEPPHDADFSLNGRLFHDDLEIVKQEVAVEREDVLTAKHRSIMAHNNMTVIVHPDNPEYHCYVDNGDLWNMLKVLQDSPGDETSSIRVDWNEPDGEFVFDDVLSYADMAKFLEIDPDDLKVWVMEAKRGHNDPDQTQVHGPQARLLYGNYVVAFGEGHGSIPDAEFVNTEVKLVDPYVSAQYR